MFIRTLLVTLTLLGVWTRPAALHAQEATTGDRTRLVYGVASDPAGTLVVTPPQVVFIERLDAGGGQWTAEASASWIRLNALNGDQPSRLRIVVDLPSIPEEAGVYRETVTIRRTGATTDVRVVNVTLNVYGRPGGPPGGVIDLPVGEIQMRGEPVRLFGWTLDDVGVDRVVICLQPEREGAPAACTADASRVIGEATFSYNTRPDVEAAFPNEPRFNRASWSFGVEPGAFDGIAGRTRLVAVSVDIEGRSAVLGSWPVVVGASSGRAWADQVRRLTPVFLALGLFVLLQFTLARGTSDATVALGDGDRFFPGQVSRWEWLVVTAVVAGFVWWQWPWMTTSLMYDEMYTASRFIVNVPFVQSATGVEVFNNHIGYSLMANVAARLFGSAEWVVRLPALLFACGAVVATWTLARMLAGPVAGVGAAVLLVLSPMFAVWSTTARGYSGLACLALLSTIAFFRSLERNAPRMAALHVIASAAAVYVHLYGSFVLAVQYAWFLWWCRTRPAVDVRAIRRSFWMIVTILVLLYAPVTDALLMVMSERGRSAFMPGFPEQVAREYFGTSSTWVLLAGAVLTVAGVAAIRLRETSYLIAVFVVPLVTMWVVLRPTDLYSRFFVYWVPVLAVILAAGVTAEVRSGVTRWRTARASSGVARGLILVAALAVVMFQWAQNRPEPPPAGGYRDQVAGVSVESSHVVAGIGNEAGILGYYLGKPVEILHSSEDVDRVLRQAGPVTLVYHAVFWNAPEVKQLAAETERRCPVEVRGSVVFYHCD